MKVSLSATYFNYFRRKIHQLSITTCHRIISIICLLGRRANLVSRGREWRTNPGDTGIFRRDRYVYSFLPGGATRSICRQYTHPLPVWVGSPPQASGQRASYSIFPQTSFATGGNLYFHNLLDLLLSYSVHRDWSS